MAGLTSRLAFTLQRAPGDDRTRLRLLQQDPPQRVVRAFAQPGEPALVHLHNLSGGILGGDQLGLSVQVGPGAEAVVTTTGATRVYRHRDGQPDARQETHLQVAEDGLLAYMPDPLIPFASARFTQAIQVELAPGAGLFYGEIVAPGREASGECFAYDRLGLELSICADGTPAALERLALCPEERPLQSPLRFGPYRYLATLYVCRVGLPRQQWLALEGELAQRAQSLSAPGCAVWGVSTLAAHGLVVRGLSVQGQGLAAVLTGFWDAAERALYGRPARPPRKLY